MESKEWPLHTFCKTDHFEASYKSCDPLQDIGFSIDPCYLTAGGENMKIAVLLRRDINALFLHINGFIRKLNVFSTILTLCELDHPKFTFCGAKKGAPKGKNRDTAPGLPEYCLGGCCGCIGIEIFYDSQEDLRAEGVIVPSRGIAMGVPYSPGRECVVPGEQGNDQTGYASCLFSVHGCGPKTMRRLRAQAMMPADQEQWAARQ
ncbi:hypothetical protein NDU88_004483 [Pleurodeles waltl]|uniref:Uncharacterized protein n=1 Tax=Pleurodeles waltl TaxID=8319 RepID=A0AAV7VH90_PLEWA|nr:hypothetical protein NDU88_004483 [Pleurodeles waltl]